MSQERQRKDAVSQTYVKTYILEVEVTVMLSFWPIPQPDSFGDVGDRMNK
jgi:hypothetical protein